jgi:hypothetical protein
MKLRRTEKKVIQNGVWDNEPLEAEITEKKVTDEEPWQLINSSATRLNKEL